jgi:pyruvate,water dikinase
LVQRELARRAHDRGGLQDGADACHLTYEEFRRYVADPTPFQAVIAERKAQCEHLNGLVPPFVFEGRQPPPSTWVSRESPSERVKVGAKLDGIPGCGGMARGRARIVRDPGDPGSLGQGDVLVAPITDPAWTPLFLAAEAVVVDVGAVMSHAVIVSRELGIPCVVSVTNATDRIPPGALLEVDGDAGTVTVVEV